MYKLTGGKKPQLIGFVELQWGIFSNCGYCGTENVLTSAHSSIRFNSMGDYRYHELRPLISYFPCHWVVPVDFPNSCPMKIVRIFYRIIARYGRDIYTLTQYFPNQQWCNKSKYDLVERLLFPLSFYRRYIKFTERYFGWSLTWSILARFKPF